MTWPVFSFVVCTHLVVSNKIKQLSSENASTLNFAHTNYVQTPGDTHACMYMYER